MIKDFILMCLSFNSNSYIGAAAEERKCNLITQPRLCLSGSQGKTHLNELNYSGKRCQIHLKLPPNIFDRTKTSCSYKKEQVTAKNQSKTLVLSSNFPVT